MMFSFKKKKKKYRLSGNQIKKLIDSNEGCIATDRITVDGCKVGFMYREEPYQNGNPDSGWRFMAGDEDEAYMDNIDNHTVHKVNTICNYDSDIIPFIDSPPGSAYVRDENGQLVFDKEWKELKEEMYTEEPHEKEEIKMEVTNQMKEIACFIVEVSGVRPKIIEHRDKEEKSSIDIAIMSNNDNPVEKRYATIGLCNYDIDYVLFSKPLRIEIIAACNEEYDFFSNVIGTCAFNIINSKYDCFPGRIFTDVINRYTDDLEMKHILFLRPILWCDQLETLHFEDKAVTWLQAIPISHSEYEYAKKHGNDALKDRLEEAKIDILNLNRKSVV